jgi:hypothetical protein
MEEAKGKEGEASRLSGRPLDPFYTTHVEITNTCIHTHRDPHIPTLKHVHG